MKLRVYRWHLYDGASDEMRVSRRLATPEGIERVGGEIYPGDPGVEVDASDVGAEVEGMTVRNYALPRSVGFQTGVK